MTIGIEEAQIVTLVDGFVPVPGPPGPAGTGIRGDLADPSDLPEDRRRPATPI